MLNAIGAMSGTSMDGIDLALIRTDGVRLERMGRTSFRPYGEAERALLRGAIEDARVLSDRCARPGRLAEAERLVTAAHADALEAFLRAIGHAAADVHVLGFHGQTVLHRPENRLTVQLGDGAVLAKAVGVPVVADFRAADVAAGGQGAPLVPLYHQALARAAGLPLPTLIINLGGVANITYLGEDGRLIACDTGPANALLDDFLSERMGLAMDRDGAIAARGKVDAAALARLMDHPFFARPAPKSLDRNAFSRAPVARLATEDGAATLTAFTAASLAAVLPLLPAAPRIAILAGGGANNPTLVKAIGERLAIPVRRAAELGWDGDFLEAEAFAFLAVRSLKGLPITLPGTTGVGAPTAGGRRFGLA